MALNLVTTRIRGFKDWHCTSLDDFDIWVKENRKRNNRSVFRGQRKFYPLLPSISRENNAGNLIKNEKALLLELKKQGKKCLQIEPENDWEWLVVGQHHGLPTRILDWSFSPYVALWFALEKSHEKNSAPEVWAFSPEKSDFIDSLSDTSPFQGSRTKIFETDFKIPRVREQKGCFTLFKYIDKKTSGFVPLERNSKVRKNICRVRVSVRNSGEMLEAIERKGIKSSNLFPDIDKVVKSIKLKIFNL